MNNVYKSNMLVDESRQIVKKSYEIMEMMDIFDDEDIFEMSDDDTHVGLPSSSNPVDDYLITQLHDIRDCITRTKNEISHVQSTSQKVLARIYKQCEYIHDQETSDSDDDWYDEHGEPILKKKNKSKTPGSILVAIGVWQRIIDDKWVIGVELQNNTDRAVQQPTFYVMIKGQNELKGVTSLWQMNSRSLWNRTLNLHPENEKIAATAVLSIPNFKNTSAVTAYGIVVYHLDGKELQTPIGTIELNALQAADKLLTPRYAPNLNASILAIKATNIEKIITISCHKEFERGDRFLDFLTTIDFVEVISDVYMSKIPETFRHCIFEILSLANGLVKLRISTRSTVQLNIMLQLVRNKFSDTTKTAIKDEIIDQVCALEQELELKLDCDEPAQLLNARLVTDLLIP